MKVGDLVIHRHAPRGEGRIRMVVRFDSKRYEPVDNTTPRDRAIVLFADGLWDWRSDWRKIQLWDDQVWEQRWAVIRESR